MNPNKFLAMRRGGHWPPNVRKRYFSIVAELQKATNGRPYAQLEFISIN